MQRVRPVQAAPAQPINASLLFGEELLARLDADCQINQLSLVFAILVHVKERVRGDAVPWRLLSLRGSFASDRSCGGTRTMTNRELSRTAPERFTRSRQLQRAN